MARHRAPADGGVYVPGLWEEERGRHLAEIARGDARGLGLSRAERAQLDAQPNSTVSAARSALARMDERGWVETWPPSARRFPAVANVPWLADRSVTRVRIHADDSIEPA